MDLERAQLRSTLRGRNAIKPKEETIGTVVATLMSILFFMNALAVGFVIPLIFSDAFGSVFLVISWGIRLFQFSTVAFDLLFILWVGVMLCKLLKR